MHIFMHQIEVNVELSYKLTKQTPDKYFLNRHLYVMCFDALKFFIQIFLML